MLIDVSKTKAILICAEKFNFLQDIPPALNNVNDFESILIDSKIMGLSKENILKITNKRNDEILEEISDLLLDHENIDIENLIIYYVGHGKRDLSGRLYLTGTNSKSNTLSASAIAFDDIKHLIEYSHIQRTIMIIDACFSGIAAQGEELEVKGSYILTSSSANELSFFDPSEEHTFFTGQLIKIIRDGIDSKRAFTSLDSIFKEIQLKLRQSKPQRKNTLTAKFNLFRNPNYQKNIEQKQPHEIEKKEDERMVEYNTNDFQSINIEVSQTQSKETNNENLTLSRIDYQEFSDMVIIPDALNLVTPSLAQEKSVAYNKSSSNGPENSNKEDKVIEISNLKYFRIPIILGLLIILMIFIKIITK